MKIKPIIGLFFILFSVSTVYAQAKKYIVHTVAFYNIENFYDTINDPQTRDDEWVYTSSYYKKKVNNIARVLSQIGSGENPSPPTIIGLAEVENRRVLEDLIKNPQLINYDYGIIHYDSPDRRGIDCAILYQKKHFIVTSSQNVPLYIYEKDTKKIKLNKKEELKLKEEYLDDVIEEGDKSKRIYTRDQVLLTGFLDGEEMNFIVNHWPTRRGGEAISSPLRELAAGLNLKIIDSLQKINPEAKVISMGDLNDGPYNRSLKKILNAKAEKKEVQPLGIYNPSENMFKKGNATLFYRDAGDVFDQIFMTEPLIKEDKSSFRYWKAGIYNKPFMIQTAGQYKGYPLRNNSNTPGFSDHFPAYIYLIKEMFPKN
ncbi:endonuclease/exonuclease/phosphatase family protein [Flavobacterium sp.]|uniref:endonuclease/exonuclease/phosphatase family protein n=1 Tax=Flavobacterium sp. TaxID=239 RepID=UPI0037510ADA